MWEPPWLKHPLFSVTDCRRGRPRLLLLSSDVRRLGKSEQTPRRERDLMAAVPTLIALESPTINKPMLMAMDAGTAGPIGPARLLQGCHRYAEAQGLHIAPRCRRAAGIQAARGPNQSSFRATHCSKRLRQSGTGLIQEALIRFDNVMTIPEDHVTMVEKQSRSGPVIMLFNQAASFNRGRHCFSVHDSQ